MYDRVDGRPRPGLILNSFLRFILQTTAAFTA